MKKYLKYITLTPLFLGLSSCGEEFLKEVPTTFVAPETLFINQKNAETALTGAYDAFQNVLGYKDSPTYGNGMATPIHWSLSGSDEAVFPPWAGDRKVIYVHQETPSFQTIEQVWRAHYKAINVTNNVVDKVTAMSNESINDIARKRIIGEAKGLRALFYFSMVKMFENIPLIKNEVESLDNLDVPQATTQEVYNFIIQDLKDAEAALSYKNDDGTFSKGVAQAVLGKVYLQMAGFPLKQQDKYALAAAEFKKVIDSGIYSLLPNYADVFTLANERSKELIISIGYQGPGLGEGGLCGSFFGPNGSVQNGGGWGTCFANHQFEESFDRKDTRLPNLIAKHNQNDAVPKDNVWQGVWRPWKWKTEKPNAYGNDTPFDFAFMRYPEVLLGYAEAVNESNGGPTSEAYAAINMVRARARGNADASTVLPDLIGLSQKEFTKACLQERKWELAYEGQRRDDLIRTETFFDAIEAINQKIGPNAGNPGRLEDFRVRWPIPQREMDLNPSLKQNPGYN